MIKRQTGIIRCLGLAVFLMSACAPLEARVETAVASIQEPTEESTSSEEEDAVPSPTRPPNGPISTEISSVSPEPSETPTPTPQPTPLLTSANYHVTDCIDSTVWRFWPSDIEAPSDSERKNCYALNGWGFNVVRPSGASQSSASTLTVSRYWQNTAGIYFTIPSDGVIRVVLAIQVIEIGPDLACPEEYICDSNLIVGVGNPEESTGAFVMYRAFNLLSATRLCLLGGINEACAGATRVLAEYGPYEDIPQHIVDFQIEPDRSAPGNLLVAITIDGVTSEEIIRSVDPNSRIFWIGYNFRQPGHLKAIIEFK